MYSIIRVYFILLSIIILIISCKYHKPDPVSMSNENFSQGITYNVITHYYSDKSNCTSDFFYYIPSTDSTCGSLPTLLLFDPHGKGKKAIGQYKDLADSIKIILVGSNQLRNGLDYGSIHIIFNCLYKTVIQNLPVDTSQILFAGFSGGGRIALEEGGLKDNVKGIICCGAAQRPSKNHPSATYVFIAGKKDFNYLECRETMLLFPKDVPLTFITFDGEHEWPPDKIIVRAITSCLYEGTNPMNFGFTQKEKTLFKQEKKNRETIQLNFGGSNLTWWDNYITELQKSGNSETPEALSSIRLLNYISMLAYMHTNKALTVENTDYLQYALTIYEKADPDNPDMFFFKACHNGITGDAEQAIKNLEKAVSLGFCDKQKAETTPYLEHLRNDNRFWDILSRIIE